MTVKSTTGDAIDRLCTIMERLRSPSGCPWDSRQTNTSLQPYLIEEAYEVIEAIQLNNSEKLCSELGDLLLQIVFHAQICAEAGEFTLVDVVNAIADKLIARHPHVFSAHHVAESEDHEVTWDRIKQQERRDTGEHPGLLSGIPASLPALQRSQKVLARASRSGLPVKQLSAEDSLLTDWTPVSGETGRKLAEDLLKLTFFGHCEGLDIEQLLRDATRHIENRFTGLERKLSESGRDLPSLAEQEWRRLWGTCKG